MKFAYNPPRGGIAGTGPRENFKTRLP